MELTVKEQEIIDNVEREYKESVKKRIREFKEFKQRLPKKGK